MTDPGWLDGLIANPTADDDTAAIIGQVLRENGLNTPELLDALEHDARDQR